MPWPLRMTLNIALISLPVGVYVALRIAGALALSTSLPVWRCRLFGLAALLLVYLLPLLLFFNHLSGSTSAAPSESHPVSLLEAGPLYLFWWGLIVILETFPYLLFLDAFLDSAHLDETPSPPMARTGGPSPSGRPVPVSALCPTPFRYGYSHAFGRNPVRVAIDGLPPALEGLRIGLIADLQFDQFTGEEKALRVRSILEDADVDLVVFAGDLVTSGREFTSAGNPIRLPPSRSRRQYRSDRRP